MRTRRRQILEDVAQGRLSPEEAAGLLDALEAEPAEGQAAGEGAGEPGTVRRVRVSGTFRVARILGDPGVVEAVARGPHAVRREGDTLVILGEPDEPEPGFAFGGPYGLRWRIPTPPPPPGWEPPGAAGRVRRDRWLWGAPFQRRLPELEVRVNPEMPLDVELWAGTLLVTGVKGPLDIDVSAGSARVVGFAGPLDVRVAAGTVHAAGVLRDGASRVRCDAGRVHVHLERGSSVRVRAKADLGRVSLPGGKGPDGWVIGGGFHQAVVGDGAATLDVEAAMGDVTVSAEQ
jgi:hypothetical protein